MPRYNYYPLKEMPNEPVYHIGIKRGIKGEIDQEIVRQIIELVGKKNFWTFDNKIPNQFWFHMRGKANLALLKLFGIDLDVISPWSMKEFQYGWHDSFRQFIVANGWLR
jgi:hypothetical protein